MNVALRLEEKKHKRRRAFRATPIGLSDFALLCFWLRPFRCAREGNQRRPVQNLTARLSSRHRERCRDRSKSMRAIPAPERDPARAREAGEALMPLLTDKIRGEFEPANERQVFWGSTNVLWCS